MFMIIKVSEICSPSFMTSKTPFFVQAHPPPRPLCDFSSIFRTHSNKIQTFRWFCLNKCQLQLPNSPNESQVFLRVYSLPMIWWSVDRGRLRYQQDRLRDHPGLVQGWESVRWGVLGTAYLIFLDLETYQDSTIVQLRFCGKPSEKPIVLDPRKSKVFKHIPSFSDSPNLLCFNIFRFPTFIKIPPS